MMGVYSSSHRRDLLDALRESSLEILDEPAEGCVLIHAGDVDYEKNLVLLPDPYPLDFFSTAFLRARPKPDYVPPIPLVVCDDILDRIVDLLRKGEKLDVKAFSDVGCWSYDPLRDLLEVMDLEDEEEAKIAKLLREKLIDVTEARNWLVGKRLVEGIDLDLPEDPNPVDRVVLKLPLDLMVKGKVVFEPPKINGIFEDVPGKAGRFELRISVSGVEARVLSRDYEVRLKPDFKPTLFKTGRFSGAECGGDTILLWNEEGMEVVDARSKRTVWRLPLKPVGVGIRGFLAYVVEEDELKILDLKRFEEIHRDGLESRVSFLEICGDRLVTVGTGGVNLYDISVPSRPVLKTTLDLSGLITCGNGRVYVSNRDGISVLDPNGELVAFIPTEENVWDVAFGDGRLVFTSGKKITALDGDFDLVDEITLHENVDVLTFWKDVLVALTKSGSVILLKLEEGFKNLGEIDGRFSGLVSCEWLYAISDDGIYEIIGPS